MTDNYILTLNNVIKKMTLYIPYVTISLGTIGGLCNLFTFTAKQLRQNACAFYFLCSAIFDLLALLFCAVMRLMVDHYEYLLPNQSLAFCKLRVYLTAVFPAISTSCVMLASIDRCLLTSTSTRFRNWSKIRIAYRLVAILSMFWFITCIHMLIFYDFYPVSATTYGCSSRPGTYSIFISIFFVVWITLLPYTIMFIFCINTYLHIRSSRHRVQTFQPQNLTRRKIDRNLMIMMFIQVILSIILLSMRTVVLAYQYITRDVPKNTERRVIESFISQLGIILYYINYAKSFYLYTLTSPYFREVFWKRLHHLRRGKDFHQRKIVIFMFFLETTVHPISTSVRGTKRHVN